MKNTKKINKIMVILLIVILTIGLAAYISNIISTQTAKAETNEVIQKNEAVYNVPDDDEDSYIHQVETEASKSPTVYITNTGSKYHRSYCQYLSKSKIDILKSDAIMKGYGACSKCSP